MSRRAWTPEETQRLRLLYGRHPTKTIQRSLKHLTGHERTLKAICIKATTLRLKPDIPRGYTRLVDVHDKNNRQQRAASDTIKRAAQRDGVLKYANHVHSHPAIAPTWWINQWVEEHYRITLPAQDTTEEATSEWVPTRWIADRLGIPRAHAADTLLRRRGKISRLARGARYIRLNHKRHRPLYWHPDDARAIVKAITGREP